ncbi:auxin-induced protein AUX22-like isoform X2 [Mercurialis annua]|uniref:auxin-induced protein AUX22-like isoform X2 n=1 Tax=Mercurialis annua TaxID=3986 RepID=UPI002160E8A6|nr:auxin-induced protein AUX22-like isoform X2 [Mercurialis annua]
MTNELGLGFEITELRLGLPGGGGDKGVIVKNEKKRGFSEVCSDEGNSSSSTGTTTCDRKIPAKTQVVGWPPVCSYRKRNSFNERENSKMYVKVSMDGAPFLRKIDLGSYKEYFDLLVALEKLFGCFGIGKALKDAESSEYAPIYEDKDGDWMLVGDVPWEVMQETKDHEEIRGQRIWTATERCS